VIDLQIALAPRSLHWRTVGWLVRRMLRYMQGVDRFHITKLHRRARPEDFTPEEMRQACRKGLLLRLHGILLRNPYRAARRYIIKPLLSKEGQ
jgi:hypothetical protein